MLTTVENQVLQAVREKEGHVDRRMACAKGTGKSLEYVVHFGDVCHLMGNGDGIWYAGSALHSWMIRLGTNSNVSHGGLVHRVSSTPGDVNIIDMVDGVGCRDVPLYKDVCEYPGMYYWSPVNYDAWPQFDGYAAIEEALKQVGKPYGRMAVTLLALTILPFTRELSYFMRSRIDRWLDKRPPFCSMFQTMCCQAGGIDPVPGRDARLTTPQDTWQSMLWVPEKYALIP